MSLDTSSGMGLVAGWADPMQRNFLRIGLVVSLYWFISISTVFVNKHLLSSSSINLDAPLFVTWFQSLVTTAICQLVRCCSLIWPSLKSHFPSGDPYRMETVRKILPLSLLFVMMVATNNLCLKYVGVAFYYVGRSLTTIFNVILSYILLHQKTSWSCMLCCGGIAMGFILGVDQESLTAAFSGRGTVFGVCGSFALALYSIQTKKTLQYVNQQIWLLSYYNNLYSCFLFLPLIILNGEVQVVIAYDRLFEWEFISLMLVGGVCGFAIGLVTSLQIKVTSPLTHNISGTAKACAQTVIATHWYKESKSILWWSSNILVLLASAVYSRVKQLEMIKTEQKISGRTLHTAA